MSTSGTFAYAPLVRELFDEAVERAGIDPAVTGGAHIRSFGRTLRLLLNSEWSTLGIRNWMVVEEMHTVAVAETQFPLPAGGMDIVEAVLRRPGSNGNYSDVEMYAITRNEYLTIVDKANQGRPDRFWVDRQAATKLVNYWQAGSNTTDIIVYNMLRQNMDYGGELSESLQLPTYAFEALTAGVAAKMALKWNPSKFELLMALYAGPDYARDPLNPKGVLGAMIAEDRERGDITLSATFSHLGRR